MNILEKANEIVNLRAEEKERQYGPFAESLERTKDLYNLISKNKIETEDVYTVLIALKLSRQAYGHKEDNLLDAVAYIGALNNFQESKVKPDFSDFEKPAKATCRICFGTGFNAFKEPCDYCK